MGYLECWVLCLALHRGTASGSHLIKRKQPQSSQCVCQMVATCSLHPQGKGRSYPRCNTAGCAPRREMLASLAGQGPEAAALLPCSCCCCWQPPCRLLFWSSSPQPPVLCCTLLVLAAVPFQTISDLMPSEQKMFSKILLSAVSILLANLLHFLSSLMQFIPGKMHKQTNPSIPSSWKGFSVDLLLSAAASTGRSVE